MGSWAPKSLGFNLFAFPQQEVHRFPESLAVIPWGSSCVG